MNLVKTAAAVVVASVLSGPVAVPAPAVPIAPGDDAMTIAVEIPARANGSATASPGPSTSASASAVPSASASPVPSSDDPAPRPGALPVTGGQLALGGAVVALAAIATGLVLRARRRRRA